MGNSANQQNVKTPASKLRIESLYEMYNQSIRLSKFITNQNKQNNKRIKKHKQNKNQQILFNLLYSFQQAKQYSWGNQIPELFKKHYFHDFFSKWYESKEFFYELLLQNCGISPSQNEALVNKSYLHAQNSTLNGRIFTKKQNYLSEDEIKSSKSVQIEDKRQESFEEYFFAILKQQFKYEFRSSVVQDQIINRDDDQKNQEFRMTYEEQEIQFNYINKSIIYNGDKNQLAEEKQSLQNENQLKIENDLGNDNDDKYFLPLITKRRKLKSRSKMVSKQQPEHSPDKFKKKINQIQLSQINLSSPNNNYSKNRIQAASVIIPNTIFYDRMDFSNKVETDQLLKIYRQISNTIQQTLHSCNLLSCPLKHFLLYFQFKTQKKKIYQDILKQSNVQIKQSIQKNQKSDKSIKSVVKNKKLNASFSFQNTSQIKSDTSQIGDLFENFDENFPISNVYSKSKNSQRIIEQKFKKSIKNKLIQNDEKSELNRKKRQYNTNYLLKEIKRFTESYSQFMYRYLEFEKFEETNMEKFINLETIYGIVLKIIWSTLHWVGERGYEWETYYIKHIFKNQNPKFQTFQYSDLKNNTKVILDKYSLFLGKPTDKIKISPQKLIKAYQSLLKLKNQINPQKYLKKIIIFYRQSTLCCQGADDLISVYEFLLKNAILTSQYEEMHLFRMKNTIEKLIDLESQNIQGIGEIVYAWTTFNIVMEMFLIKLKDLKNNLNKEKTQLNQFSTDKYTQINHQTSKKQPKTERKAKKMKVRQRNSEEKEQNLEENNLVLPLNPEKK